MVGKKIKTKSSKNKENVETDKVELTSDEISEFICQIQAYPILWNKNHNEFKNTNKKGSICKTIGDIYDIQCKSFFKCYLKYLINKNCFNL